MIKKVLFVCRGNVARSQFGEAFLKRLHPELEVSSAGTKVIGKDGTSRHGQKLYELGEIADNVIISMKEKDFNLSNSERTQLNEGMVDDSDLVIVMAEKDNWPEYLNNNSKAVFWDVLDPKGTDLYFHRKIRDGVLELVKGLKL
jgi:protein-tyrosine-phosphatase